MQRVWRATFLVSLLTVLAAGQDDFLKTLNSSDSSFWNQYEVVTQPPLENVEALEACGEGDQLGKFLCVPYYNCDPKTNEIVTEPIDAPKYDINVRFTDRPCQHYLDKCCEIGPNTQLNGTNPSNPTGTVTNAPFTSRPPITNNNNNANTNNNANNNNNNNANNNNNNANNNNNNANNNNNNANNNNNNANNNITVKAPSIRTGSDLCGTRNPNGIDFQVTGNKDNEAEFGEFPWMVAVLQKSDDPRVQIAICGGSLIAPNVVLTGAHCVVQRDAQDIKVRAGEWDSQTQKERIPFQERDVVQVIMHEAYAPKSLYNDVALLILTRPLSKVESVGTICLPTQGQTFDAARCLASGWGKDRFGKVGQYSAILKKIELPLVDSRTCENALRRTRLGSAFNLHRSFVCAGGEADVDTCTGDGGSPLVCPDPDFPNRYVQVGIVSWGISCGMDGVPGVYGDVTQFRTWVDQKLKQLDVSPVSYTIDKS